MYHTEKIEIITLRVVGTEQMNVRSLREKKSTKQQNKIEIHITWFAKGQVHEKDSDSRTTLNTLLLPKIQ